MPLERDLIIRNITQKDFRKVQNTNTDHDYYYLFRNGLQTKWWIKISRGSNYKVYGDDLIKRQAVILGIRYKDLNEFMRCDTDQHYFIKVLQSGTKN